MRMYFAMAGVCIGLVIDLAQAHNPIAFGALMVNAPLAGYLIAMGIEDELQKRRNDGRD